MADRSAFKRGTSRSASYAGTNSRRPRIGAYRTINVDPKDESVVEKAETGEALENPPSTTSFVRRPTNNVSKHHERVVSQGLTDRLKEKKRAERNRVFRRIVYLMGVGLVVGLIAWFLLFSPFLAYNLKQTKFTGVGGEVTSKQLESVLKPYDGTPLLRISTSSIEKSISKLSPWVKSVQVTSRYPHGLGVAITQRKAVALLEDHKFLSQDGTILNAKAEHPSLTKIESKCPINRQQECYLNAAKVLGALPSEILKNVKNTEIDSKRAVILKLKSGKRIIWGTADDTSQKVRIITILLKQAGSEYNISDYANPTVK